MSKVDLFCEIFHLNSFLDDLFPSFPWFIVISFVAYPCMKHSFTVLK